MIKSLSFTLALIGATALVACGSDSGTTSGGGGSEGGGSDGGSNTTTAMTTTNTMTTASSMNTTNGNLDCTGQLDGSECGNCVEGGCCAELTACGDDADCAACLGGGECPEGNAAITGLNDCIDGSCSAECAPEAGGCARWCCTDGDCDTGVCDKDLFGDANVGVCVTAAGATDAVCTAPATSPSGGSCVPAEDPAYACNPVTNEGCDTAAGEACDVGQAGFECYPAPNTQAICDECGQAQGFCAGGLTCL